MNAVSLFAGVGGFDLALEHNGVEVVAAVEWDKNASGVLANRFPNTKLFGDVKEVSGDDLRAAGFIPESGIITGGFPCQDVSVAGKRAGLGGERSSHFWEIVRLVDDLKPKWLLLENVPGLLSSNGGRDMGIVLGALGKLGYGFAYRVLDAQYFGVPQRRRRVFIVGCLGGDGSAPAEVLALSEGLRGYLAPSPTEGQKVAGTLGGGSGNRGWAADTDRMTFVPVEPVTIYDPHHDDGVTPPPLGELKFNAGHGQHGDYGNGNPIRPGHQIIGRDIVGTLSAGAHPGGLNGQDAYTGQLVVCEIPQSTEQ